MADVVRKMQSIIEMPFKGYGHLWTLSIEQDMYKSISDVKIKEE